MFLQAVSGFFRLALPVLAIIALTSGSSHACEIDWEVDPAVDCQEELENENKEESVNMINGGRNCPKSADTLRQVRSKIRGPQHLPTSHIFLKYCRLLI
ncbi:MAG: hypothetical protein O3C43_21160 [Verrucomicrobia bacterium]|nr:hypothetical protein [Verrucomicrobiota bacterium]